MVSILAHAQQLVYTLLSLMPSDYQKENLEAMLGLFLSAQGYPLPEHSKSKSASALSRFLNLYDWSTRSVIRTIRARIIQEILSECPKGRKPFLQVIIDLTTLEKFGKFKEFNSLISVYNRKRGLHLVVVYLVVGQWRVPWSFRVWRGKGTTSPAQLGLKLVKSLPSALRHFQIIKCPALALRLGAQRPPILGLSRNIFDRAGHFIFWRSLTKHFKVMILADTAFGSIEFLHGIRKLKYHAIVGVRVNRKLVDGRILRHLHKPGQQVRLVGLKFPVMVSWYYLKRDDGKKEKRFVMSTKPLKASTINWWGKRRWQIEGWFKIAKHRFGLHRFGQGTLLGVYRWLILSLIAYILAHWAYLSTHSKDLPDWGEAAQIAFQTFLPQLLLCCFLLNLERMRPIALSHGIDIHISRCKI